MENGRKLLRWIALAAIAVIGIGGGVALFGSSSQAEDIVRPDVIRIDAIGQLKKLDMPPAVFLHDKHTEALAAQGKDCSVCHTAKANGKPIKFLREKDGTNPKALENLYHENCIGCHADMAKQNLKTGPQDGQCRACHDTKTPFVSKQAPINLGDKSLHYMHVASKEILSPGHEENCGACHHVYDPKLKKLVWEKGKEDACAACHGDKAEGNKPALKDAVHSKCAGCHASIAMERRADLTARAEAEQAQAEGKGKNTAHYTSSRAARESAAAQAAAIEAAIITGPDTCAGCHTVAAQEKYRKIADVPRLMRGQPDATVLLPVHNDGEVKRPVDAKAGMKAVVFNHKAHEAVTDDCRVCHHKRISSCTDCHTVEGKKEGNFVTLADAMHSKKADQSCVGCHQNRIMKKPECAGCHIAVPVMSEQSCGTCHKDIKGITQEQIADGSAGAMSKEELAAIASADIAARAPFATPIAPEDIPEKVSIGILSNEYEPSIMPHRKIYEALLKGIGNDKLAASFHTSPTSVCAACHHRSPVEGLKNPPKCASCHGIQTQDVKNNKPSLKAAYHQQCMACHDSMKITKPAATDCAGCHAPRKNRR